MSRICLLLAVAAEAVSALQPHHERRHEHLRKVFAESVAQKDAQADSERDVFFSVGYLAKSQGHSLKAEEVCKGADHCCTKFKPLPQAQLTALTQKLSNHNSRIDKKDVHECAWDYEVPGCFSPHQRKEDNKWVAHARTAEWPGKGALICKNDGGWVKVRLNQEKEKASSTVTLHLGKDEAPHAKLIEEAPKDLADNKFSGGFYRNWGTEEENKNRHKYKFYSTQTLADRLGDFAIAHADGKIAYRKFYAKASGSGALAATAKNAAMDAIKSAAAGGSLKGAAMAALKGPAGRAAKAAAMKAVSNYVKRHTR